MRRVEYALYYLPPAPGRRSPHVSRWLMTAAEAAAHRALGQVPGSAEIRDEPETEAEHLQCMASYPSAGRDKAP